MSELEKLSTVVREEAAPVVEKPTVEAVVTTETQTQDFKTQDLLKSFRGSNS